MSVETLSQDVPDHLKRFIVDQYYERYTPIDQSVWRYIIRQLYFFLSEHGHPVYLDGLKKTGISLDQIPRIEDISAKMAQFGWKAIPVSGFIPPAAFMEFQSLGFLPIASDMRSTEHIFYTPAPDIVHEAAGHAPIIADPEYAEYLRKYAAVAKNAILSHEDLALYDAIRDLSDIKEHPDSTGEMILAAEKKLSEISAAMTFVSEAAYLGRMNWWTAEYGLMGSLEGPKVFGAGLLSSVGECRSFLDSKVKKIPLSLDCINFSYDITEPQPQLFVAKDCAHLESVLEELAETMAFRQGGLTGLKKAAQAKTVNTIELSSGLQISGKLSDIRTDSTDQPIYISFSGPCQLAHEYKQIHGHGPDFHQAGYGTALGNLVNQTKALEDWDLSDLAKAGLNKGEVVELNFVSGVKVSGVLAQIRHCKNKLQILTFDQCTVNYKDQVLFDPSWGIYDLAIGANVTSVYGGPADRKNFFDIEDFTVKLIPLRSFSTEEKRRHHVYQSVRDFRQNSELNPERVSGQVKELLRLVADYPKDWLPRLEILEVLQNRNLMPEIQTLLNGDLRDLVKKIPELKDQIEMGLNVIDKLPLKLQ